MNLSVAFLVWSLEWANAGTWMKIVDHSCPLVLRRLQSASESATEHRETMVNVVCEDCQAPIRRLFGLLKGSTTPCSRCNKALCGKCSGNHALIPFDENEKDEPPKKESILSYCKQCFQEVSLLDYSKTYDIVEPSNEDGANNDITLLWVHGGGSSRLMFRPHARLLAKQGYRSILMDLPGHGTLVDNTTLTLDECVKTVQSILQNEGCDATKTIYIGGSLGAYIGFHILKELNGKFAGAILMDCGQNVGPDCSLKARIGIVVLRKMSGSMSNKALMGAMMGAVNKSKADFHLVESCYSGGMFFQQGPNQCDCMHQVAPASIIPSLDLPILFFNGSEDYRDSELKWVSLCQDGRSSLKVYDKGDHFFCHDSRFVQDMLERMQTFFQSV